MQTVSQDFIEAMQSDHPNIVYQLEMDLGNYALPIQGSGITASSIAPEENDQDFAASYMINQDRTHIHTYWKGAGIATADGIVNEWVEIDLGYARLINKIKIWGHPYGHLKDFSFQYWDGTIWQTIETCINNIALVKTIIFSEVSTSKIKMNITKVGAYEQTMICEIEIYRIVDLTDRMISCEVNRNEYQAGQLNVMLQNYDRAFSPEYKEGLYYGEIKPNLNIRLKLGFEVKGQYVFLPIISGLVDEIIVDSATQLVSIKARDWIKRLINRKITSPLYFNKSYAYILENLANLGGISSAQIDFAVSTPNSKYAHFEETTVWQAIGTVVEAIGTAEIYFTEDERLILKRHLLSEDYGVNPVGGQQISSLAIDEDFVHVFCGVNNGYVVCFQRESKNFVDEGQIWTYRDTGGYGGYKDVPVLVYDDAPDSNNMKYGGLSNNRLTRLPAINSSADIGKMIPSILGAIECELGKTFLYKEL